MTLDSNLGSSQMYLGVELPPFVQQDCLFVANLPKQFSNEQLANEMLGCFQRFGQIRSLKTARDASGRPFGFVEYSVGCQMPC